jgi:hypothetical protein
MSFTVQSLVALAVTVGLAVVLTTALTITGVIWRRQEIREFLASQPVTIPARDSTEADDARELVLR